MSSQSPEEVPEELAPQTFPTCQRVKVTEVAGKKLVRLCGEKSYREGRCFPHWRRNIPREARRQWDEDFQYVVDHSPFVHNCPKSGHRCPYQTELHDLTAERWIESLSGDPVMIRRVYNILRKEGFTVDRSFRQEYKGFHDPAFYRDLETQNGR